MLNLVVIGSRDWGDDWTGTGPELQRMCLDEWLHYVHDRCGGIGCVYVLDEHGAALRCKQWCEVNGVEVVVVAREFRSAEDTAGELLTVSRASLCVSFGDCDLLWVMNNKCKALGVRMLAADRNGNASQAQVCMPRLN